MPSFSDYIVFVDESGDHGLESIDPTYPMFVLAFCVFEVESYITKAVPSVLRFKFKYFGHDQAILHEREIRRGLPPFGFTRDKRFRAGFFDDLNALIKDVDFRLVASAIRKEEYRCRYAVPGNPYHVAMGFGLERVFLELHALGCKGWQDAHHLRTARPPGRYTAGARDSAGVCCQRDGSSSTLRASARLEEVQLDGSPTRRPDRTADWQKDSGSRSAESCLRHS